MPANGKACATCKHYAEGTALQQNVGTCRVDAPKAFMIPTPQGIGFQSQFPPMMPEGWCAKHEPGLVH